MFPNCVFLNLEHKNGSITYGSIESINHVTDSASHLSSYISSEFGEITDTSDGNTDRLAFNYVHAKVIGNDKGIYTPVLHGNVVTTCTKEDILKAYGLDKVKNPLPCGYLEMYGEQVPVNINADFIVGPDGAHLNISGISVGSNAMSTTGPVIRWTIPMEPFIHFLRK